MRVLRAQKLADPEHAFPVVLALKSYKSFYEKALDVNKNLEWDSNLIFMSSAAAQPCFYSHY